MTNKEEAQKKVSKKTGRPWSRFFKVPDLKHRFKRAKKKNSTDEISIPIHRLPALRAQKTTGVSGRFDELWLRFQNARTPRLTIKEQAFLVKRLSFLIKAGVPLLESLHMLREQTRTSHGRIIEQIIRDVENGQSLSRSLGKFPNIFGDFAINIIKVGESSGILSENLDYLADELKKRQVLRRKVTSALVYPALITVAILGITAFLMIYLFPKIMPVFTSLHMTLPLSTRIVMFISEILRHNLLYIVVGLIIATVAFLFALKRSKSFHRLFDRTLLKLPILGRMIQYYNLANSARTLGLLLKSGVTLSGALPITSETTANLVYKHEFLSLAQAVNRGERISAHLAHNRRLFPDIISQMVAVGEKSGSLSHTLVYLSELYEMEVDEFTKNLSSLIEPVLMIFMGIVVGFIAISIITPIYGITQNLHQ